MTIEEMLNKIQDLTKEADKYLTAAKMTNNSFVTQVQFSLYKMTMEKIHKLEKLAY